MVKFPEPPAALRSSVPEVARFPAGTTIWRIYSRGGPHSVDWDTFRDFGPTDARFDHHLRPARVQARAILYGARRALTCFAEVFQQTRTIHRRHRAPWLTALPTSRELALLDLTGAWPTRAGASMAISTGPRARARRWSQSIYNAFPDLDGLLYCSSMHANEPAIALYERARAAMPATPLFNRALSDPAMRTVVVNAAVELNYVVL